VAADPKSAGKRTARRARLAAGTPVVSVTTQGGPFAGLSAAAVRRRASKMLDHLALRGVELSVALVDDLTIHGLNKAYRRKDKPTDVLAFPMAEAYAAGGRKRGARGPLDPVAWSGMLGDVIISIDTAARQAAQRGRPLLDEITMLLGHGLLHLLGYDHKTNAEEREMTARTQELEAAAAARAARAGNPAESQPRRGASSRRNTNKTRAE
jgi:probable rRNA maturation factor